MNIPPEAEQQLAEQFASSSDAAAERANLGLAVQQLYDWAAEHYPPLLDDKGKNYRDGTSPGRMDCVDHSTNVAGFIKLFAQKGWLRFHQPRGKAWRASFIINLHYTAVLREQATGQEWAVDSWFKDFGAQPIIVPLTEWEKGYSPS